MRNLTRSLFARPRGLDVTCGGCGRDITVVPCVFCGWSSNQ
jgi:hypothetical protein